MIPVGSVINSVKSLNALHGLFIILISEMGQILRERERLAVDRLNIIKRRQFISKQKDLSLTQFFGHTSDHGDLALRDGESLSRECWDGGCRGVGWHGVDNLS